MSEVRPLPEQRNNTGLTGFDGLKDTCFASRVMTFHQPTITANNMDSESAALWAEFDALEGALV